MSTTFARRPTTQTPHLSQPSGTSHPGIAPFAGRTISGRFVVARPCKVTYLAADSAPGIGLEIDPSQTA
jgi:hypothetical protein